MGLQRVGGVDYSSHQSMTRRPPQKPDDFGDLVEIDRRGGFSWSQKMRPTARLGGKPNATRAAPIAKRLRPASLFREEELANRKSNLPKRQVSH